jgi:hypothetical protein
MCSDFERETIKNRNAEIGYDFKNDSENKERLKEYDWER